VNHLLRIGQPCAAAYVRRESSGVGTAPRGEADSRFGIRQGASEACNPHRWAHRGGRSCFPPPAAGIQKNGLAFWSNAWARPPAHVTCGPVRCFLGPAVLADQLALLNHQGMGDPRLLADPGFRQAASFSEVLAPCSRVALPDHRCKIETDNTPWTTTAARGRKHQNWPAATRLHHKFAVTMAKTVITRLVQLDRRRAPRHREGAAGPFTLPVLAGPLQPGKWTGCGQGAELGITARMQRKLERRHTEPMRSGTERAAASPRRQPTIDGGRSGGGIEVRRVLLTDPVVTDPVVIVGAGPARFLASVLKNTKYMDLPVTLLDAVYSDLEPGVPWRGPDALRARCPSIQIASPRLCCASLAQPPAECWGFRVNGRDLFRCR